MQQKCTACRDGLQRDIRFSMAFQPIVDVTSGRVFAYEALVRGANGEGAGTVLSQVNEQNRYAFDQGCRVQAITLASQLDLPATGARLSINFMPGAVYSPSACIQLTLKTARAMNFPLGQLIFEFTEGEEIQSPAHLQSIADEYRKQGFLLALDDMGAGFTNLNLLARISADIVKLDMDLIRDLPRRPRAQKTVTAITQLCHDMGMQVVGEGVETYDEYLAMQDCGLTLMQGYLLAKPAFERLPEVTLPALPKERKAAPPPVAAKLALHRQLPILCQA